MGVQSAYLFGSAARDQLTEQSDVDVLIEIRRPFTYIDLGKVEAFLSTRLVLPVDLGTFPMLKPSIRQTALKDTVRAA